MIMNGMKYHAYDCNANACVTPECYRRDPYATLTRQHRTTVAMGMIPTVQIRINKTIVRSFLVQDGIHDRGLNTEAIQTGGEPRP
jgi:hypothetical protein